MITLADDETTPLLGTSEGPAQSESQAPLLGSPVPGPSTSGAEVVERVHFLDNLRAVLTVLLILHHTGIFVSLDSLVNPQQNTIPLALFITFNKSFLYEAFFFVSGYSIHLGLLSKSDAVFFKSRVLKTGLPALLWLLFARKLTVKLLVTIFGDMFGSSRFGSAYPRGQLEGPGSYVFTLLIFDAIYLLNRLAGRRWPAVSFSRLETRIKDSRKLILSIFALSFILVAGVTIGNCFGLRLIPFIHRRYFPFEFPGFGTPVAYIVAYIAGVNFPLVKRYILFKRPQVAVAHLFGSATLAFVSLGIYQHHSRVLRRFISASSDSEGARYFAHAGLNGHTIFFSIWSSFVCYVFTIALVSTFVRVRALKKNFGIWADHTYIQTYIHMVPVAIAADVIRNSRIPVVRAIFSGIVGVLVSWAVALLLVHLRREIRERRSQRIALN